eukprot:TRINITY_DN1372_c1_g1_i1.p1 TRINITY_DN1372_c1_g1~~TRINITY_DN1372_c1_g1_i1.p1  ORF type:complete len:859 (+),score=250.47 TRINITY_DN1372_c1_g1_i1:216-2792(+)
MEFSSLEAAEAPGQVAAPAARPPSARCQAQRALSRQRTPSTRGSGMLTPKRGSTLDGGVASTRRRALPLLAFIPLIGVCLVVAFEVLLLNKCAAGNDVRLETERRWIQAQLVGEVGRAVSGPLLALAALAAGGDSDAVTATLHLPAGFFDPAALGDVAFPSRAAPSFAVAAAAVAWAPAVTHADRAALEAHARARLPGFPGITTRSEDGGVVQQRRRDDYVPILAVAPPEAPKPLGLDLLDDDDAEPLIRAAATTEQLQMGAAGNETLLAVQPVVTGRGVVGYVLGWYEAVRGVPGRHVALHGDGEVPGDESDVAASLRLSEELWCRVSAAAAVPPLGMWGARFGAAVAVAVLVGFGAWVLLYLANGACVQDTYLLDAIDCALYHIIDETELDLAALGRSLPKVVRGPRPAGVMHALERIRAAVSHYRPFVPNFDADELGVVSPLRRELADPNGRAARIITACVFSIAVLPTYPVEPAGDDHELFAPAGLSLLLSHVYAYMPVAHRVVVVSVQADVVQLAILRGRAAAAHAALELWARVSLAFYSKRDRATTPTSSHNHRAAAANAAGGEGTPPRTAREPDKVLRVAAGAAYGKILYGVSTSALSCHQVVRGTAAVQAPRLADIAGAHRLGLLVSQTFVDAYTALRELDASSSVSSSSPLHGIFFFADRFGEGDLPCHEALFELDMGGLTEEARPISDACMAPLARACGLMQEGLHQLALRSLESLPTAFKALYPIVRYHIARARGAGPRGAPSTSLHEALVVVAPEKDRRAAGEASAPGNAVRTEDVPSRTSSSVRRHFRSPSSAHGGANVYLDVTRRRRLSPPQGVPRTASTASGSSAAVSGHRIQVSESLARPAS